MESDDVPRLTPCPKEDLIVGKQYYLINRLGVSHCRIVELMAIDRDTANVKEIAVEMDVNRSHTPGKQFYHDPNVKNNYCVYLLTNAFYELE